MGNHIDPKNFDQSHSSYKFFFGKKLYENLIYNIMGLQFLKSLN